MIKRIFKRALPIIMVLVWLVVSSTTPALAIADPDTPPSVNFVGVYEDLMEDGDCGLMIEYYLDYAVPPTETAAEAYMGIFVDTDGTTQLKSVAPYVFQNSGYDGGLIWIYFTAAEVTLYSIDSANEALYRVWLCGNPTLAWAGDPPKTTAVIDYWQPALSDTAVLMAVRVLYYADFFELAWTLDLVEGTPLGNRLTVLGESYFENVIPYLRVIAPNCFAAGEIEPTLEDIDYSTEFGAVISDGTGTLPVSPLTLVEGANTVTVNVAGTFIVELEKGTVGDATTGTLTVNGSPVTLVWGTNTITVAAAPPPPGNIIVTVDLENTQTIITDTITGTGLDLTTAATAFGMTRTMFSGLIWLLITILICWAVYKVSDEGEGYAGSGGKTVLLVFDVCIIGGAVLGLLPIMAAILMFIAFGGLAGYVLFFRGASI